MKFELFDCENMTLKLNLYIFFKTRSLQDLQVKDQPDRGNQKSKIFEKYL